MQRFLKDKKGETLVETLAAILIFAMASIVLYSMVTRAAEINKQAREKDNLIAEQIKVVENIDPTDPAKEVLAGKVTFQVHGKDDPLSEISVNAVRKKPESGKDEGKIIYSIEKQ